MSRNDMESLLHKYLFDGYQKDVHPLMEGNLTQNKAVSVTFDAQVIRILQVVSRLILTSVTAHSTYLIATGVSLCANLVHI